MNKKLLSTVKVSLWLFLAMNCISCAHQSNKSAFMIDKETPSEEHVWSESQDVEEALAAVDEKTEATKEETVAAVEEKSEDGQLEAIAKEEVSTNNEMMATNEVSKLDETALADTVTNPEPASSNESKTEPSVEVSSEPKVQRDVASEPPADEVTPPSQVEPTIGSPSRLKNNDSSLPSKKPSEQNRSSSKQKDGLTAMAKAVKNVPMPSKEPTVELVPESEMLERVLPKPAEPTVNALGEEEDSTPELASVEIANFVQRHWLITLVFAMGTMGTLYFMVGRKRNEDSQSI